MRLPSQLILSLRRNAYGRLALIFLACLLPFSLARLALYLAYFEDFKALGTAQVALAFLVGLRFDLSIVALYTLFPLTLMLLPFRWAQHIGWQRLWGWVIYCALLLLVCMLLADTLYFGEVRRHVGSEITTVTADIAPLARLALTQYAVLLALSAAGAVLGARLWQRLLRPAPAAAQRKSVRLGGLALVLLLLISAGRGGWSGKPLSVSDAFFSNTAAQAYLALNGAFAVTHAMLDGAPPVHDFMPQTEAIARTQNVLAGSKQAFQDPAYPLFQPHAFRGAGAKPNVVVLVLESWGAQHIDALRRHLQLPPLGATPNFDALAKQGRLYTHFYANGQRSIQGAESILASLPTPPGMPFLGEGIEQNRQSFLGELAQSQHYATFFLQSDYRGSFRFNAIAARAGFATYKGAEDMQELHARPKPPSNWGTWDHNTLQEAHQLFAHAQQPFLGYIFTSTTHAPFMVPQERWRKYPEINTLNKYLNSLYYADWAIAELMAAAKKAGYYDNTIFVLTGDHASGLMEHAEIIPNLYHIPLLIVGPGVTPGVDERIGSQLDILPTIAELANWSVAYAGLGRSLLDTERVGQRVALGVRGNIIDLISARGWVSHNLTRLVGSAPGMRAADAAELERSLLAQYQTVRRLMMENHIQP
ncbi:MAG: LTA synthase family protein [Burkholderiales bacterium]|nr:LTA synthase family protein [Burkholderiales bacterium]